MQHFLDLAAPIAKEALLGILALAVLIILPKLLHYAFALLGKAIAGIKQHEVQAMAYLLVRAAQQAFNNNQDKFTYVANLLCARFPWLPPEQVKANIEAAVGQMKADLAAIKKPEVLP